MLRKANRVIANRVIANRVIANRVIANRAIEHGVISKYWKCIEKLKPNEKLIVDDLPHYTATPPLVIQRTDSDEKMVGLV